MSRHPFGWSLPPGVTTLPGEEDAPRQMRCKCGSFLPSKPFKTEPWEDGTDCDGKVTPHETEYTEGEIRILGEEFRGKKYTVYYSPCGEQDSLTPHKPHREIHMTGAVEFYRCRKCGATTEFNTL